MDNIKKSSFRDAKNSKANKKLRLIILIAVVLIALVAGLSTFITDIMWFDNMGYLSVFLTELLTKIKLGVPSFVLVTLLGMLFLSILKKNFYKDNSVVSGKLSGKKLKLIMWGLSAVFGAVLMVSVVSDLWFQILQFIKSTDFNVADPLFGKDVSFYVFKLEFLEGIGEATTKIIIALFAVTAIFYLLLVADAEGTLGSGTPNADGVYEYEAEPGEGEDGPETPFDIFGRFGEKFGAGPGRKFGPGSFGKTSEGRPDTEKFKSKGKLLLKVAKNEISILGILLCLSVAFRLYLKQFDLLYRGTGACYGAGFTDVNITLNVYRILIALSLLAIVGIIIAKKKNSLKIAAAAPVLMVAVFLLGSLASVVVQNVIVSPDELNKEEKYLQNNLEYTRLAYDLADIKVEDFSAKGNLSKVDVLNNMETFSNIRINDFDPAERFYNQTQSIRSYYCFNDVDVDRYFVNGEYTQVFLSARELDASKTDDSWLINHLLYTHGYGITLSRVDRITSSGQPEMLIDSIPPVSEVSEIDITRPEIYYGERTDNYIITNAGEKEFDYPSGESNVYCDYEGEGGIKLGFLSRVLFSIREGSLKLLVSSNIDGNSRIHIYRNIMTRIQKIAPFLAFEDDPYVVVADGKIYWMLDAYTLSEYYPYSEPFSDYNDVNYIRNSIKITVDAYNGNVDFYMIDTNDPIAQTLSKIYPGLIKDISEMPDSLKAHIQYPNALFSIQAQVYAKYHMSDVAVFYQSEDLWSIANEFYGQATQKMTPNYFIMKLPGEDSAEFVSTIPYTPNGKANMSGILMARNDGENYGEIVLYRMPKDKVIYGPEQIEAQINQDAEISKEFTLWNNSGSTYSRGNMFAIPVADSILYVEPVYLESSAASLPEVKRVIAYYGEKVAYEATLSECLDSLFGDGAGAPLLEANPIEAGRAAAEALLNPAPEDGPQDQQGSGEQQPVIEDPGVPPVGGYDYAALAQNAYENALEAMQSGDWTGFGKYMDELAEYINKLTE